MKEITNAILNVYKEISKVSKDSINEYHKYEYVSAEHLIEIVRKSMLNNSLIIGGINTISFNHSNDLSNIIMSFKIIHVPSGEEIGYTIPAQGLDKGDKAVYKALTGGFKYFLRMAFMLEMCDDPEADSETDKKAEKKVNRTELITGIKKMLEGKELSSKEKEFIDTIDQKPDDILIAASKKLRTKK